MQRLNDGVAVNWNRIINGIYAALFVAVAAWAGVFFLKMNRELAALRTQEEANRVRLAEGQEKLNDQTEYLRRLRTDPELIERIIRKKLGYADPREFVFRFEENSPKP